jgi:hypothetical protein
MINSVLYFVHYALLLTFGIALSAAFAGVRTSRKNTLILLGLLFLSSALQLAVLLATSERLVWMVYPLIAHLPIVLLLCIYYRKRFSTALAAVTTAYLCCHPAKWVGTLFSWLTDSYTVEQVVRIVILLLTAAIILRFFAGYLSEIYQKDDTSVYIFGIVPIVYYVFDYAAGIYTDLWVDSSRVAIEFLPLMLCIVYILFCLVYFREYERKNEAERKEQIIRLSLEQQGKELDAVKRSEQKIRLIRHDMRQFLASLAYQVENDPKKALEMISTYTDIVDSTAVQRYCEHTTINYVLSRYAVKCEEQHISFSATVQVPHLTADESMLCSILSNALDNALNAQKDVPEDARCIKVMLKTSDGRLLLSVKNTFGKIPPFSDGMPVTKVPGHGYGTKSIRYLSERLGGNCQFTVEDQWFILRMVV